MTIPKEIIEKLSLHVETEIQAGRRLTPLDTETVVQFLAIPEHTRRQPPPPAPHPHTPSPAQPRTCPVPSAHTPEPTRMETLDEIAAAIDPCQRCRLHESRNHAVAGAGRTGRPDFLFVGEGPGVDEDACGRPFVGRAGQLLTNMIAAMGYSRDEVFISNIVKCHPPGNRTPEPDEMAACLPWLRRQIQQLKPRCIITLGAAALCGLEGNPKLRITKDRGVWRKFEGIPVMPTFHPAYLLRYPNAKREVWEDLKKALAFLGKTPPRPASRKTTPA